MTDNNMRIMRSERIPSSLFIHNRSKLAGLLPAGSMAIICSNQRMPRNGDQYFPYRPHSDFFYLSGICQEGSILLMMPDHPDPSFREILLILQPTQKEEVWEGPKLSQSEAAKVSGIPEVRWKDDLEEILSAVIPHVETIYNNIPEKSKLTHHHIMSYDEQLDSTINARFPGMLKGSLAPLLSRLRMIKEPEELSAIKGAIEITGSAFERVLGVLKPGMMEYDVEAEIIHAFLRSGAEGHAYDPIIASGKNALILHYTRNNSICQSGEMLLLDFGAEYQYYAADCTRTIPVSGVFSDRQLMIYRAVQRMLRKAIPLMTAGKRMSDYVAEVASICEKEHVDLGLYTMKDLKAQDPEKPLWKQYMIHGVSHSLGLDVHDPFDRSMAFAPGMVLTCEPAIYLPGEGLGIRLENDVLITEDGPIDLMVDIALEPEEIEQLMQTSDR